MQEDAKSIVLDKALQAIEALRSDGTRVHSITNTVAQNFTANVLLACNAKPSMTVNPDEVEAFTRRSDALHINLGTLDNERMDAIQKSMFVAKQKNKPVTLDPVMAHVSPLRAEFANSILHQTDIVRGNQSEMDILDLGNAHSSCLVMTGEKDKIINGKSKISVDNGHPIMAQVIATGCALGGLIAALSSKTESRSSACLAALLWFGVAGELSAERCSGPGSFSSIFIDILHHITLDEIKNHARIS